jgi:hypothetical protein
MVRTDGWAFAKVFSEPSSRLGGSGKEPGSAESLAQLPCRMSNEDRPCSSSEQPRLRLRYRPANSRPRSPCRESGARNSFDCATRAERYARPYVQSHETHPTSAHAATRNLQVTVRRPDKASAPRKMAGAPISIIRHGDAEGQTSVLPSNGCASSSFDTVKRPPSIP